MTNISQIFKSEISRVARKEVRQEIEGLRKASAQHRGAIAALRREVAELQRQLGRLNKAAGKPPSQEGAEDGADQRVARRFSPTRLASHRTKLGLSAAHYGQLVGVSGQTIFHWEQGKARPRAAQLEAIAAVRGIGKREAEERLVAAGL
ncbi:XRE family transcriptional regulator [Variovorax gossypii]|uniref:XRE family transcriptional regulator n=1 Tax=Variovorax gossypii TaxID=1679495 RepID=A0A3S0HG53_9BURK|nr:MULTISPECIES: helix-turn-helix transcriptional regulator [Variovorax]MDR6522164.1 DNA-binding transcriptional regulator YiaG [Variovorax paradoxus]RTQ35538.1 XRE family transcriptional regulator [Variovorax gossypii]